MRQKRASVRLSERRLQLLYTYDVNATLKLGQMLAKK